jgi:hypothetical protein
MASLFSGIIRIIVSVVIQPQFIFCARLFAPFADGKALRFQQVKQKLSGQAR